jgi:hypothetical protein
MHKICKLIIFITSLFLLGSSAFPAELNTPERVIKAYFDGITKKDINAVIATSAAKNMSERYDFSADVLRSRALSPYTPAPAIDPFFIEYNRRSFESSLLWKTRMLVYSLLAETDITSGHNVQMDAEGAAKFVDSVRLGRLSGLTVVKVAIPKPSIINSTRYQAHAARVAHIYGADTSTERMALIDFEGRLFQVGFTLLQYGNDWLIQDQTSPVAGTPSLGAAERVTPEKFDEVTR